MSFIDLNIKTEYRSQIDNVVQDFYLPILNSAVNYKRAVGFFSSSALAAISKGITGLKRNDGHIQLVASPRLSEEDIEAINKGYADRNSVIKDSLIRSLDEPKDVFEKERLNLLANLIAEGRLDIKIALLEHNQEFGMFHEKMGLLIDQDNNKIAFSGSMNETTTAMRINYEAFDVFCSWKSNDELSRVTAKENAFEAIWSNSEPNIQVVEFPEIKSEILAKYKRDDYDSDIDIKEAAIVAQKLVQRLPHIPDHVELFDYQTDAIDTWEEQSFRGIFDMATGTGKTFTGLGAIVRLSDRLNGKLAIVIVCPFQHLVEQWVEDIRLFNINPIIGYSSSSQKDWKKRLDNAIRNQKMHVKNCELFCFICTNATYMSDYVQGKLKRIRGQSLLVVDEAHNFGATRLRNAMLESFDFRLALSATLERHNDDEGTYALLEYFGKKCIIYPLERAIKEKKLTPYRYYPVIVNLSDTELEVYETLSREIAKCVINDINGRTTLNERGKKLALKRARTVAAAEEKISKLNQKIEPYKNDKHILVYCGATKLLNENEDYTAVDDDDLRQIDVVTKMLDQKLNMKVSQFTSKEDVKERSVLKKEFANGDRLQVLIAIKCLDEGVNIPAIKVAFILASTTNPKEYIQRRGRVLRKFPGKEYAEIYDFITLPRPLCEVSGLTREEMEKDKTLVKNEVRRAMEFSRISLNYMQSDEIISDIRKVYELDNENIFEEDINVENSY